MTHTVVGLFNDRTKAQAATQELTRKGFMRENIDVSNRRFAEPNNALTGVTVTEPTITDNISEFFSSLFGSDKKTAANHARVATDADAIICIQVDSLERAREAAVILDRHGAIDVDGQVEQTKRPINLQNQPKPAVGTPQDQANTAHHQANIGQANMGQANMQNGTTIPIIEEELQLAKQVVEREGARVRSRVIEKPVEANLRLREEHVVVGRRPVNRPVTDADLANFRDEEFVLTERAEVPVIGKEARVVEEIVVGKNVTERNEVIHETVRRTDVEIENIDNGIQIGDSDVDNAIDNVIDPDADLTTRRAVS